MNLDELTPKQQKNLQRLIAIADGEELGVVSELEDLEDRIDVNRIELEEEINGLTVLTSGLEESRLEDKAGILQIIKDLKAQIQAQLEDNVTPAQLQEVLYSLKQSDLKFQGLINKSQQDTLGEFKEISRQINEEIKRIERAIPVVDLSPLELKIQGVESKIPTLPEPIDLRPVYDQIESIETRLNNIPLKKLEELERLVRNNLALPITTTFIYENGRQIGRAKNLNFTGSNLGISIIDDTAQVPMSTSTGGRHVIEDEGTPLTQRTNLNFVGAGVTVTDDPGNDATVVTILGGGSGGTNTEVPTPAADGVTMVFSVTNQSKFVIIDEMARVDGFGYTLTGTGPYTITVNPLVTPPLQILSVY